MNLQAYAVKVESLFREVDEKNFSIADSIRTEPYTQITENLKKLQNKRPQLEQAIREFLIKHQGMQSCTLDVLYAEGYNLEEVYDELYKLFYQ